MANGPERVIELKLHRKLQFLMEMCPYKVAYGGRNGLKSWAFARALLTLGLVQDLRILCVREVQESIAKSVHQLLKDQIIALGYSDLYDVTDEAIRCRIRDTQFGFTGLSNMTSDSIKSFEGTDVCWAEEAHKITKRSWQILLPTIFRVPNAEVWISFNPDMDDDDTWERFVVHPPEGAKVVEMNWRDAAECGWFPPEQEKLRQYDLVHSKADYDNIWEGKPRSVVAGAIYSSEITDMVREKRFRPMPRDPRLPVHRIWDLGWNDLMTVVMVQKPTPSSLVVVNYIEDRRITYAEMIQAMKELRYVWGEDWLPHDASQGHPTSGTNARAQLKSLGCKVKSVPKSNPENRIRAARMMFPRIYIDDTKFDTPTDRPDRVLGAGFLVDRLKRYKRHVPKVKELAGEDTGPVHDINCLGPDTMIRTLDGWKRISELVGKNFHVWGYSHSERRIVPAKALNCWKSGIVEMVAKVTLDSGVVITCTLDHRFMRRDGSYAQAQLLAPNDSLMPFYETNVKSHTKIHLTDGTIADEHRYVYSRLVGNLIDGMHVHHRDDNKRNNDPLNFEQLTPAEHCSIHSSTPEHKEHLRRIGNRKGSAAATTTLIAVNKMRAGDNHHTRNPGYWTDERRLETGEGFSRSFKASETQKICPHCGGSFMGNWKRVYCCSRCKDRSRHKASPSRWKTGSSHCVDCLLIPPNNHRVISIEIVSETTPVYDIEVEGIHNFVAEGVVLHNSHGADAFGGLAEIVDQIRNPADEKIETLPGWRNPDPSMGLLG